MSGRERAWRSAATALLLLGAGCSESGYVETGDLPALQARGELRILMPPWEDAPLHRNGYPLDQEVELAERFARDLGLAPRIVLVEARDELLRALEEGRGDLAMARLTVTPERRERFLFSVPLDHTREILVLPAAGPAVATPADMAGLQVTVRTSASFHRTLRQLQREVPELEIIAAPETWDTEEILARVAEGEYDATVADEDVLETVLSYRDDLAAGPALTGSRPRGWAMRRGSPRLKAAVDGFLHRQALLGELEPVLLGDLEAIRERKVLRVLTRNNAVSTYLHGGQQAGFEFELARRFARSLGCRLRLVIPPEPADLVDWLLDGRGDLIAASLSITPERRRRVAFSRPYLTVTQTVVARVGEARLDGPADLAGRTLAVRAASSYRETLRDLQERGIALEIETVDDSIETEELIRGVGEGTYDLTVADSHILAIERGFRDDVQGTFVIGEPSEIAWAMRPGDDALREAVDAYLGEDGPGSRFFNVLRAKYLTDEGRAAKRLERRPERTGLLSPYDELFREYGRRHDIDWRLLAAQAFQESRFRKEARSHAGAQGLMQVRPRTARSLGVTGDLRDPEASIQAGALYLRHLADRYFAELPFGERLRFALGAYNAGPGHIRDGRRLAREKGLDENVWFGNVDKVLPLLQRREYARRARSGYCRCEETVRYVREIHDRYEHYIRVVP